MFKFTWINAEEIHVSVICICRLFLENRADRKNIIVQFIKFICNNVCQNIHDMYTVGNKLLNKRNYS